MADFRRRIPVLALLFLILGSAVAFAQPTAALQCIANAGVPPLLRAEGITDLTGDIVLNCTGGNPTPAGVNVPQANIQVFLNTNVTSRLLGNGTTEALLMIDEPQPANQLLCGAAAGGSLGVGGSGGCTVTGAPGSNGVGTYNGTVGRPNIFQSQLSGNQSVLFLGVPIDPPGSTGARVIRITNIRANSSAVAPGGSGTPGQVLALISASPQNVLPINNPQQIVGYVQRGLIFSVNSVGTPTNTQGNQTFAQCTSRNTTTTGARPADFLIRFTEGFATAFKTRTAVQDTTGATSPAPVSQAVPGQILTVIAPATAPAANAVTAATESGFYNPNLPAGNSTNIAGLADFGTRLQATFNNVPNGVILWVSLREINTSTTGAHAVLVSSDSGAFAAVAAGSAGTASFNVGTPTAQNNIAVAQLTVATNSASATWEVTSENALALEALDFAVFVQYSANAANNLPTAGQQTSVNGRFAPVSTITTASATAPVPRFVDTSSASNVFVIRLCVTNLLFPFVTNSAGFDTGVEISNTSADPFGTANQAGPCVLNFYGDNRPAAPVSIAGTSSAGANNSIAAGSYAAVTLSTVAPNFTGYIIAVCNFQYAHGFAFISDLGVRNFAQGYVALVIGDGRGTPNNLTQNGSLNSEVLGQ